MENSKKIKSKNNKTLLKNTSKKRKGNFYKLFRFSTNLLMISSVIVLLFSIILITDGLANQKPGWGGIREALEVLGGMITMLMSIPMLFSTICAFRYFHGKSKKLTACFILAITPYSIFLIFPYVAIYLFTLCFASHVLVAINTLLLVIPDIIFIRSCSLEAQNKKG